MVGGSVVVMTYAVLGRRYGRELILAVEGFGEHGGAPGLLVLARVESVVEALLVLEEA